MNHYSQNHRICWVERDPRDHWVQLPALLSTIPKNYTTCLRALSKGFLSSVRLGLWPLPWWAVPGPNHPLSEEAFPSVPPEPPLAQLQASPSDPVTGQGRDQCLPLLFPSQGTWGLQGLPSISSRQNRPRDFSCSPYGFSSRPLNPEPGRIEFWVGPCQPTRSNAIIVWFQFFKQLSCPLPCSWWSSDVADWRWDHYCHWLFLLEITVDIFSVSLTQPAVSGKQKSQCFLLILQNTT